MLSQFEAATANHRCYRSRHNNGAAPTGVIASSTQQCCCKPRKSDGIAPTGSKKHTLFVAHAIRCNIRPTARPTLSRDSWSNRRGLGTQARSQQQSEAKLLLYCPSPEIPKNTRASQVSELGGSLKNVNTLGAMKSMQSIQLANKNIAHNSTRREETSLLAVHNLLTKQLHTLMRPLYSKHKPAPCKT